MGASEHTDDTAIAEESGATATADDETASTAASTVTDHDSGEDPADLQRWKCALVGGLVGTVSLPLFPASLATGGAVAGYLRKGDTFEGITVGALAGLPPTVPVAIGALYLINDTDWRIGVDASGAFTGFEAAYIAILLLVFIPAVFAILSAVGGALGVHVHEDL